MSYAAAYDYWKTTDTQADEDESHDSFIESYKNSAVNMRDARLSITNDHDQLRRVLAEAIEDGSAKNRHALRGFFDDDHSQTAILLEVFREHYKRERERVLAIDAERAWKYRGDL